jgi:UDP-N-acetylglucosamine--N-acetylmuramyl-(pentapeptide) pyrophosphoryl-undecaprenol N-acetylglucosamine transferase
MRILLVGGGSGGHVYPLVAVADALKEKAQSSNAVLELLFLGEGNFARDAAIESDIELKSMVAGKVRRYFSLLYVVDLFKSFLGLIQSFWYLFWFMPDIIFVKGGYASLWPAVVGKIFMIPVYAHESDSIPGLANRFIAKLSNKIFISFTGSEKYFDKNKVILVGNPVRKNLFNINKAEALQAFSLDPLRKTILVLGGSQGAKKINDAILGSLFKLAGKYQIIHQCGRSQLSGIQAEAKQILGDEDASYMSYSFFNTKELALAYAACDVIISRAGAGSIFEAAMAGKPTIVVPITLSSSNHQLQNAIEFSHSGAVVLEEQNMTTGILANQIESLLRPENYNAVCQKIKTFARPHAANEIAEYLIYNS